jgi:hypothetical protein
MGFENDVLRLTSSVNGGSFPDERTGFTKSSVAPCGAPGRLGSRPRRLTRDPSSPVAPAAAALSWLLAQTIGGFATYCDAMNSVLLTRVADDGGVSRASMHAALRLRRARRSLMSLARRPQRTRVEPSSAMSQGWSARIVSPIVSFWSQLRREREIRLAIAAWESLDDWMLRDLGVSRSRIEHIVRFGDDP